MSELFLSEYITKKEAAKFLSVSEKTLERMMKVGLKHYTNPLRFTRRDLIEFREKFAVVAIK